MIGEPKPQGSTDTSTSSKEQRFEAASREDFASNAEQVSVTREAIAEAAMAGDFDKAGELAQMAKGLKSDSAEMMSRTEDVARAENAERDAETARKAAEAKAAEDAARAEQAAAHAAIATEDAAKAAALAEQIKSGNVGGEAKSFDTATQEQQESVPSRYRGTVKYSEDGSIPSIFLASRFDPVIMLEAYKKNPRENVSQIPVKLLEDQKFVAGLKKIYQERFPEGNFDKFLSDKDKFSDYTLKTEDIPTDEHVSASRTEAVIYNLGQGSQTLEEMGVSPEEVPGMFKKALLAELNDRVPNFGTNLSKIGRMKNVQHIIETGGVEMVAVLDDPEVRKKIQDALPAIIQRAHGSNPWGDEYLQNYRKTLRVTPDEMKNGWEQAQLKYRGEISANRY